MVEKKPGQMKRREWLFKAAEAAALALFGTMGLKEVAAAVVERVREKMEEREVSNLVAQELTSLSQVLRVERCIDVKYTCNGYQERLDCNKFDCETVFTCIGGDFVCGAFDCSPWNRFRCYGYA
jgi:hypothetical protein